MRLLRLIVRRMPGIDHPFELGEEELSEGLTLIVGANATGKSSICRAVQALLWPGSYSETPISVEAHWEREGRRLSATREGAATHWQLEGQDCSAPDLPSQEIAAAYTLNQLEVIRRGQGHAEQMIVEKLRLQAAGGYSVEDLLSRHFQRPMHYAKAEKLAFLSARKAQDSVRQAQAQLGRRVEELEGLSSQQKEAALARDRVAALETARDLLAAREQLEERRQSLAAYPAGMEALSGDEYERLRTARERTSGFRQQLSALDQEIESVEARIEELSFEGAPLPDSVLETWKAEAHHAEQIASELSRARERSAGAARRLELATEKLGLDVDAPWGMPEPAQIDEAIKLLSEHEALAASLVSIRTRLALYEETARGDEIAIQDGIAALEDWLGAPRSYGQLHLLLVACFLLLAAAVQALAWTWSLYWQLLTPFTLFGLAWAIRLAVRRAPELSPSQCASRFQRLGLEEPGEWSHEGVRLRLNALRSAAAAGKLAEEKEHHAQELRVALREGELRAQELQARREAFSKDLGFDPETGPGAAALLVSRLRGWQEAREVAAEASGRQVALEDEVNAAVEKIAVFLRAHGDATPSNAPAARAAIESLGSRSQALRAALDQRELRTRERDRLCKLLGESEASIAGILALVSRQPSSSPSSAALDADAELSSRCARLAAWREATEREKEQAQRVKMLEERIAGARELLALTPGEVEESLQEAKRRAEELDGIRRKISDIEADVRKTERDHDLEAAMAEVDRTRSLLVDRRDDALFRIAGQHLLNGVREVHDRMHEPAVMSDARRLFEAFTAQRYELCFERTGQEARFRAVDRERGETLTLSQLSDGTRSQLLLAVRLAFITHAEQGASPLPLFLDEVLSATDPHRYLAIARNLLQITEDQARQVIYLSCDPGDVHYFKVAQEERGREALRVVDLGRLRRVAEAMPPAEEPVSLLELVPGPEDGESAEEYGQRIHVPRWTLWNLDGTHLFYLLQNDLQSLHSLLKVRVRTVAMFTSYHAKGYASDVLGEETAASIAREVSILDAFLDARRIGRGRPVDRFVLEASAAVSPLFLDQVADLAASCDGDSKKLLAALRARKVSKFHTSKINDLEHYLEDNGYLDARDPLVFDALQLRVLRVLEPMIANGDGSVADLSARLQFYYGLGPG